MAALSSGPYPCVTAQHELCCAEVVRLHQHLIDSVSELKTAAENADVSIPALRARTHAPACMGSSPAGARSSPPAAESEVGSPGSPRMTLRIPPAADSPRLRLCTLAVGAQTRRAPRLRFGTWPRTETLDSFSPGADVVGVSPVPVQMWQRRAQSRCRCGGAEPSCGADASRLRLRFETSAPSVYCPCRVTRRVQAELAALKGESNAARAAQVPHLHRDWAGPCPHLRWDWARPCPHLHRD
jgi:hypothetical protein